MSEARQVHHAHFRYATASDGRPNPVAAGSAQAEAGIVADHLVEANLRGHDSHGVGMISSYTRNLAAGTLIPNRAGRILREDGAILLYDGERGYGQVVARRLTELGIERAGARPGSLPWRCAMPITSAGSAAMASNAPRPGWSLCISSM